MRRSTLLCCFVAITFLVFASTAGASLIRSDPFVVDMGGTGFGNVLSLLTLQNPDGPEEGGVSWGDTGGSVYGDIYYDPSDTLVPGSPHTLTRTIGEIGWESAAEIMLIYNVNETGGATSTTIDDLVLSIYSPTGGSVWSSGPWTDDYIADISQGTGQSGFGYRLDATQVGELDGLLTDFSAYSDYRVGLYSSITAADDGPDTFFVARLEGDTPPAPVPEPTTMLLLGSGLIGLAGLGRKKFFKKQ